MSIQVTGNGPISILVTGPASKRGAATKRDPKKSSDRSHLKSVGKRQVEFDIKSDQHEHSIDSQEHDIVDSSRKRMEQRAPEVDRSEEPRIDNRRSLERSQPAHPSHDESTLLRYPSSMDDDEIIQSRVS